MGRIGQESNKYLIGEATRNVPKEIKSRYPLIPWRLIGGMRNI
ncbi:HepT-like ribonuclease domain-containing protein [Microcystis aeruginosa]|nr:HepT-like ribonuclease domain-containing protein [Microcystis aeruginosa]